MSSASITPPQKATRRLSFGRFVLDQTACKLTKDGVPLKIQPQPLRLLALLMERSGEVVTRDEIQSLLWGDATFVDFEHGINFSINRIRAALSDHADHPRFVETIPRVGYRFLVPVTRLYPAESIADEVPVYAPELLPPSTQSSSGPPRKEHWIKARWIKARWIAMVSLCAAVIVVFLLLAKHLRSPAPPLTPEIRSLAVLPLEDLSGGAQDYFADGMTDELISDLGHISALRVISRTSAMQYKGVHKSLPQIARELHVDAIVEGTVLRQGDVVRIKVNLIQAASDKHLWSQSYTGNMDDMLGLQNQVASAVADNIRIKLTPREQIVLKTVRVLNPESQDAYLRARYFAAQGSIDSTYKAISYYRAAIAKDAKHASAWAGLASAYVSLGHNLVLAPQVAFPEGKKDALEALKLDPGNAGALTALANVEFLYDWDFDAAERDIQRAIQSNPNYFPAYSVSADFLAARGRPEEAVALLERALPLDPIAPLALNALDWQLYWARRYEEAIRRSRTVVQMYPDFYGGHLCLGLAFEQQRDFKQALPEVRKAILLSHDEMWRGFLAHAMALSGDTRGARKILREFEARSRSDNSYLSPWWPAMIYPALGDEEQAFHWLEKAYAGREHDLVFSRNWPMFDPLRSDPRYQDLMRRVGLPQ